MSLAFTEAFDEMIDNMESTIDTILDNTFQEDAMIEDAAAVDIEDATDVAHSKEIEEIVNTAIGSGLINDRDIDAIDQGAKVKNSIDDDARKGAKDKEVKEYAKEVMESGILTRDEVDDIMRGESLADILNINEETDLEDLRYMDDEAMADPFEESLFDDTEDMSSFDEADDLGFDESFDEDNDADFFTESDDEDLDDEYDDNDDDDYEDSIPAEDDHRKAYHDEEDGDEDHDDVVVDVNDEAFDDFEADDLDAMMEMNLNSIKPYNSFEGSGINAKQKGPNGFLVGPKNDKDEAALGAAPAKQNTFTAADLDSDFWDDIEDPSIDDMDR